MAHAWCPGMDRCAPLTRRLLGVEVGTGERLGSAVEVS
jgi:hypothetical protein